MKTFIRYLMVLPFLFACGQQDSTQKAASTSAEAPATKPQPAAAPQAKVDISGQVFVVTKGRDNIKLALVEVAAIPEKDVIEYIKARRQSGLDQQKLLMPALETSKNEATAASNKRAIAAKRESQLEENKTKMAPPKYDAGKGIEAARKASDEWRDALIKSSNEWAAALDEREKAATVAKAKQSIYEKKKIEFDYFDSPKYFLEKLPSPLTVSKTDADGKFTLPLPAGKYAIAATTSRSVYKDTESYYWLVWVDTSSPNRSLMLSNDNLFETKCAECVQPEKIAEQSVAK